MLALPTCLSEKIAQLFKVGSMTQSEVARKLSLDRSTLNRFLRGEADIGASRLVGVLREFDIDLVKLVDTKIDEILGRETKQKSVGEALESALAALDPISQRTILSTVVSKLDEKSQSALVRERDVLKQRISKIRTVRRKHG